MNKLTTKAQELRRKVLDLSIEHNEAHLGGSFSEIEILISLYNRILKKEDKFILSKGHCSFPMYLLLQEQGFNPKIDVHPEIDEKNGVYCTTGSLGHGFPIGTGMAFAKKFKKESGKIYVLCGDGECEEGTTWETALIASKYKLDNLTLIIDNNHLQGIESLVLPLENFCEKFQAFGWDAKKVNGHNFNQLIDAIGYQSQDKPYVVVADTVKGKGVSYMENDPIWHARMPTEKEIKIAYEELKK